MRTGTPIGKNYVTLCIERIFAEEPRQVDHKYAILRNQQQCNIIYTTRFTFDVVGIRCNPFY